MSQSRFETWQLDLHDLDAPGLLDDNRVIK
jgi:hypothetical protein